MNSVQGLVMVMANNDIEICPDVASLVNGGEQWMACRKKFTVFQDEYFTD
jgi:hypothetical protein